MKRVAIILTKHLERGQAANVAAILMGQLSVTCPEIYEQTKLYDLSRNLHAGIRWSTVLLESNGSGQLLNFVQKTKLEQPNLVVVLFSQVGQGLHNAFLDYQAQVSSKLTQELVPIGVAVFGDDLCVRGATKKFTLLS